MQPLKQHVTEPEKFNRIRKVMDQYKQTGAFENYAELADYLDYSKNTLYKIMAGTHPPPDILIYKFCEYYKLNPAYFFGRADALTRLESEPISAFQIKDLIELQKTSADLTNISNRILVNIYEKDTHR